MDREFIKNQKEPMIFYSSQLIISDTGNSVDMTKMWLNKSEITEYAQSLCKIFFQFKRGFLSKEGPGNQVQDTIGFLLYSCCVRYFFGSDGFLQGENKKSPRTQHEHSRKNMFKNGTPLQEKSKINFTEALYTLCNLPFS